MPNSRYGDIREEVDTRLHNASVELHELGQRLNEVRALIFRSSALLLRREPVVQTMVRRAARDEGVRIALALSEAGMTQAKIAPLLGMPVSRLSRLMRHLRWRQKQGKEQNGIYADVPPLEWHIRDLSLSVRAANCCQLAGIETVQDLVNTSEEKLLHIKHLGRKSVEEIKAALSDLGLSLGMPPEGAEGCACGVLEGE